MTFVEWWRWALAGVVLIALSYVAGCVVERNRATKQVRALRAAETTYRAELESHRMAAEDALGRATEAEERADRAEAEADAERERRAVELPVPAPVEIAEPSLPESGSVDVLAESLAEARQWGRRQREVAERWRLRAESAETEAVKLREANAALREALSAARESGRESGRAAAVAERRAEAWRVAATGRRLRITGGPAAGWGEGGVWWGVAVVFDIRALIGR